MALKLRSRIWVTAALLAFGIGASTSCDHTGKASQQVKSPEPELVAAPRRAGYDAVVAFLPNTKETRQMWASFQQELSADFDVIPCVVHRNSDVAAIAECIEREKPRGVVLVNNPTVRLYQKYQRTLHPDTPALPAVILMSSFLEEFYGQIPNATGIAYEVPLITSVVNLRTFLTRDIRRVGVLSRPAFSGYIARQQKLAAMEDVSIVEIPLDEHPTEEQIETSVEVLCRKVKVDALWILNDNVLLNPETIVRGWMPAIQECHLPVIVGVGALVNPEVHFGSFAMLPDHEALGAQAAELIYELAEDDWTVGDRGVDLPLSVTTTVDINQAREHLGFREDMIGNVDVVVE